MLRAGQILCPSTAIDRNAWKDRPVDRDRMFKHRCYLVSKKNTLKSGCLGYWFIDWGISKTWCFISKKLNLFQLWANFEECLLYNAEINWVRHLNWIGWLLNFGFKRGIFIPASHLYRSLYIIIFFIPFLILSLKIFWVYQKFKSKSGISFSVLINF